jgi:siderophore synthetase component
MIKKSKADLLMIQHLLNAIVRENLLTEDVQWFTTDHPKYLILSHCNQSFCLQIPIKQQGAFTRFAFDSPIIFKQDNRSIVIEKLMDFIEFLRDKLNIAISESLVKELINSRDNLVLAYQEWERRQDWSQQVVQQYHAMEGSPSCWIDVLQFLKREIGLDEYLYSEGSIIEGHPLHPNAKTKYGLTDQEIVKYAPEFAQIVPIRLILIPRKDVQTASVDSFDLYKRLFGQTPKILQQIEEECRKRGGSLDDYQLFFVHPWQYEHILPELYRKEWDEWIHLPFSIDSRATLSFRTMALLDHRYHVKLPVYVQATSAIRTVSPETAMNGPRLSRILNELLSREEKVAGRMVILPERFGAYFDKIRNDPEAFYQRNLAFILRDSPRKFTKEDEMAWVGASLTANNPWEKTPLLLDLIKQFFMTTEVTWRQAVEYFEHYTSQVLEPFIVLIQKYGVALEGHMQNTLIITKNGRVTRCIVRDLGGIRIDRNRLQKRVDLPHFRSSSIFTQEIEEVYQLFFHSVLQNHFGEMIFTLASNFEMDEKPLWKIVHKYLLQSLDKEDPYYEKDKNAFMQPIIQVKALLSMRINQVAQDYIYSPQKNPLVWLD